MVVKFLTFMTFHFGLNLQTGYQAKLNLTDFPKVQDAHTG